MAKHELTPEQKILCQYIQAKIVAHNNKCNEMKCVGQYLSGEWNAFITECRRSLNIIPQAQFLAEELAFEVEESIEDTVEQKASVVKE